MPRFQAIRKLGADADADWSIEGPILAFTRIRFRHWWLMPVALVRFRRLYASASSRSETALLRGAVAIENPWTLVNASLWRDKRSLLLWSGRHQHVVAVRWTYKRAAETWSSLNTVEDLSESAQTWHGILELSRPNCASPALRLDRALDAQDVSARP